MRPAFATRGTVASDARLAAARRPTIITASSAKGLRGMSDTTLRLAVWSGPRNISTAMMRAWGNRRDTFVTDEPLYAHYLLHTGVPHPGAEEVIASQETDWRTVAAWLTGPVPEGKAIWYQKHMAHHLLPRVE